MVSDLGARLANRVRDALQSPLPRGQRQAIVTAIASSKGGVGKTTTAVNLAYALAATGKHVLLIDLDPQAHVLASLRIEANPHTSALGEVLLGRRRDVQQAVFDSRWETLKLAGSDKGLGELEMVLAAKIGKELLLDVGLQVARTFYDHILFDCPPNLGTLTLNALCAADNLLVPTDMSALALEGVVDIIGTVDTLRQRLQRRIELCGIVATRFDKRATQVNQSILGSFAELYGERFLNTRIPQCSHVNRAHLQGEPVMSASPSSTGAVAYKALADELTARWQGMPSQRVAAP